MTHACDESPWPFVRAHDRPRMVNVSRAIQDLSPQQRRAIFDALKRQQPEIAALAVAMNATFGPLKLYLDPQTAERVLGEENRGEDA